ncbi:hypothetical protein GGR56DRAFT_657277 [Xylariaceae sp. FL0804]|nr:hypothetical protein GGR56DRAFT_657277 [Xylariaceae sp. FL0804]
MPLLLLRASRIGVSVASLNFSASLTKAAVLGPMLSSRSKDLAFSFFLALSCFSTVSFAILASCTRIFSNHASSLFFVFFFASSSSWAVLSGVGNGLGEMGMPCSSRTGAPSWPKYGVAGDRAG